MSTAYDTLEQSGHTRSIQEGLAMIRDAAGSGDIGEYEKVVAEINLGGFWRKFQEWKRLNDAICDALGKKLGVANELINSSAAGSAEREWAEGKRDEATKGMKDHGCSTNVS